MDSKLLRLIADKQENGEEFALITVLSSNLMTSGHPGTMMVVDQFGQIISGGLGDSALEEMARHEAERSLSKGISSKTNLCCNHMQIEIFINVFSRKEKLILIGSGNLVMDIYQIAVIMGYAVIIADNKPEMLHRGRFPLAHELWLGDVIEILQGLEIDDSSSIVIASHHHEFDEAALLAVIYSPARYIGMLGNKRKVTAYYAKLNELGVDENLLSRVHIPIGLDLGGQKTADISLAVMAEIQAVKHGRSGGFLSIKQIQKGKEKREELY